MDIPTLRLLTQRIARAPFDRPGEAVSWLGAVQAQDYLASLWAVGLRTRDATEGAVEAAIADGSIVRTWPMRGTLHYVGAADVRWMLDLLTPRVIARSAPRMRQLELDEDVIDRSREEFVRALEGGRRLTRSETYAVLEKAGIPTAGQRGYHILWRCAQDGLICLGPRRGKQQTFVLLDEWVPTAPPLARDEALAALAARYFTSHGPATVQDFGWWSGLAAADVRRALELAAPGLIREAVGGRTYWLAPGAHPPAGTPAKVALLPAFDEYLVGYTDRGAALDPADAKAVNAGGGLLSPTVVVDGRVAGTWKRTLRRNAVHVRIRLLSPAAAGDDVAIESAARDYARFLGLPLELSVGSE